MSAEDTEHLAWLNQQLTHVGKHANDLRKDIKNGVYVIEVLQLLTGKHVGKFNGDPKFAMHRIENWKVVLNFAGQNGVDVGGLSPEALHNTDGAQISRLMAAMVAEFG